MSEFTTQQSTRTMTPSKYQPDDRLIDDPEQLRKLKHDEGLSIREIAEEHAEVSRTAVHEALVEHGITEKTVEPDTPNTSCDSHRGRDPPSSNRIDWSV